MSSKKIYTEKEVKHMRRECAEHLAKEDFNSPYPEEALEYLFYNGHIGFINMPVETLVKFWEEEIP